MNSGKKLYKKNLYSVFPYVSKVEKRFLNDFTKNIDDNASYESIVKDYGDPLSVAHAYYEDQEIDYLLSSLKKKRTTKLVFIFVFSFLLIISLIYGLYSHLAYLEVKNQKVTEITETLIIDE